MSLTWLAVQPLDTVVVRDGRPFDAGSASRARSISPPPSTFGGVVHAALERPVNRIVGPVLRVDGKVFFPTPADVVRDGKRLCRLSIPPRDLDETWDLDAEHRLSHSLVGVGDPVEGWLTRTAMTQWLRADTHMGHGTKVDYRWIEGKLDESPGWTPETRLGLARRWEGPLAGTAAPGMLYAITQLRMNDTAVFLLGCETATRVEKVDAVVPMGGRGRLAHVRAASEEETAGVLPPLPELTSGRVAIYLATAALLADKFWCALGARLCAVACTGPQPVASASPRLGFTDSRQLAWAAPAGTVYYLEFPSAAEARTWAERYHGHLLDERVAELSIVTAGFGTCLVGRW